MPDPISPSLIVLQEKDREIAELRQRVAELEAEVVRLRARVREMEGR